MLVERRKLGSLPADLQDRLKRHSLYSSPGFLNLWRSAGGRPVAWLGDKEEVVLVGVEFGTGPFKRFQAAPDGCYCRPIYQSEPPHEEAISSLLDAVAGYGYARVYLNDFDHRLGVGKQFDLLECRTTQVDISDPAWEPPDSKLRSEIRKAEREGAQVQTFSVDQHLDRFMDLMAQTEARHRRKPRYSARFFRELGQLATVDQRVIWTWVEVDGQAAASHIYLIDGASVLNWQVYFDKASSPMKPNQFTLFTIARRLAGEGVRWLNLGATPPNAASVSEYKAKWGGVPHSYVCLHKRSWLGRFL